MPGNCLSGQRIDNAAWSGRAAYRTADELAIGTVHPDAGSNGPAQPDLDRANRYGNTCPVRRGLDADGPAHQPGLR